MISVATMFGALRLWVDAGWVEVQEEEVDEKVQEDAAEEDGGDEDEEGDREMTEEEERQAEEEERNRKYRLVWKRRDRAVLDILISMGASHFTGFALWYTKTLKTRFPVNFQFSVSNQISHSVGILINSNVHYPPDSTLTPSPLAIILPLALQDNESPNLVADFYSPLHHVFIELLSFRRSQHCFLANLIR